MQDLRLRANNHAVNFPGSMVAFNGQIGIGAIVETAVSYQLLLLVHKREHTVQWYLQHFVLGALLNMFQAWPTGPCRLKYNRYASLTAHPKSRGPCT
jgi:hypothetical protein